MEQNEQQYVTIKEFATLANVTTQAIYKRLNQADSSLNKYVQNNGKMKLISKDALELFADNQQGLQPNTVENSEGIYENVNTQSLTNLFSAYFDTTLKVLSDQINFKDQQIKELMSNNTNQHQKMQDQLIAKDKQINELQRLIDQQQQLHRAEQEQFRLITAGAGEKKGFFKRLFHKKEQEVEI